MRRSDPVAIIPARVDGIDTVIIGFGPGPKAPLAIVVWQAPDRSYHPRAVPLSDIELTRLPRKFRQKLSKAIGGTASLHPDETILPAT